MTMGRPTHRRVAFENEQDAEDRHEVVEVRIAEDLDGVAHQPRVLDEDVEIAAAVRRSPRSTSYQGMRLPRPISEVGDAIARCRCIEETACSAG
jgi:hypothetical protein